MLKNDKKQDPRKGDDRNLVLVDQDFGQPDLEDRIWLFWIRNKVPILSTATLAILGTLGVIAWFALADYKLESLQAEYQSTADTPEAKLAFARANAGVPLAGIAALDAADRYYSDKKYTEATAAYVLAKDSIAPTDKVLAAFAGRAQLGIAFSKLNAGDR
ncbi:MAG: hypothetical protein LBV28_00930, partial [Puniceicoccales bacterium]|nr:hypothetical protein [Puniceicoccales bacterium]